MNNKILIPIIIVVAIVTGVIFYLMTNPSSNTSQNQEITQDSMMEGDASGAMPEGSDQMVDASDNPIEGEGAMAKGSYISYSKEAFDNAKGKRRVYFFHANWCPTCKVSNKEFEDNLSKIPGDVVLFKTDYDTEKELKNKFAITYQHTFVLVDENGNEVKKWNGGGINELISNTN